MTVTNDSTINFWGELKDQLKGMLTEKGTFTINSLSGTVVVTDSHRNVETVAQFLENVTQSVVRQVDLEVEIYEIALNESTQLGVNWDRITTHVQASTFPGELTLPDPGGLIVRTPVYGNPPPASGINIFYNNGGTSVLVDALKQQGDLKVVSRPRLRTLNNQPAVVRVGQDFPIFTRTVTITPGTTTPLVTETEGVETITVGTVLSITPQVSPLGLITLDITPAVSRLVRMAASATGNTNAPVIDIRQASSIVRVRDGATIVMGGMVQDSASTTRRKVPLLGDIPLVGKAFQGKYETSERTELIFFITPRIIGDPATENSVKTAGK